MLCFKESPFSVVPLVGTWIEIELTEAEKKEINGRSSHRNVDRSSVMSGEGESFNIYPWYNLPLYLETLYVLDNFG